MCYSHRASDNGAEHGDVMSTPTVGIEIMRLGDARADDAEDNTRYWRPSYTFHWLKRIGGEVNDAYEHFRNYRGKQRYDERKLDEPTPYPKEDDNDSCSVWSHMRDSG